MMYRLEADAPKSLQATRDGRSSSASRFTSFDPACLSSGLDVGRKCMDHLEYPPLDVWEKRREWFESTEARARGEGSYFTSEQACALTADVQACFCAGAWTAVVIVSMAVVDAALRETEVPGFRGDTKQLIRAAGANPKLQAMRKRRNALVHFDPDAPALTVDQQWEDRAALETEAREAVELMFEAFYIGPWV